MKQVFFAIAFGFFALNGTALAEHYSGGYDPYLGGYPPYDPYYGGGLGGGGFGGFGGGLGSFGGGGGLGNLGGGNIEISTDAPNEGPESFNSSLQLSDDTSQAIVESTTGAVEGFTETTQGFSEFVGGLVESVGNETAQAQEALAERLTISSQAPESIQAFLKSELESIEAFFNKEIEAIGQAASFATQQTVPVNPPFVQNNVPTITEQLAQFEPSPIAPRTNALGGLLSELPTNPLDSDSFVQERIGHSADDSTTPDQGQGIRSIASGAYNAPKELPLR